MSTLVCVPIMVESVEASLADAALAQGAGAELVEFRVDRLFGGAAHEVESERLGAGPIRRLVAGSSLACIVTCRSAREGGEYEGEEDARLALYEALGGMRGAAYLDFEYEAYARSVESRRRINHAVAQRCGSGDAQTGGPGLILSAHDFEGRPANLFTLLARMRQEPVARVLKIAWRARSLRDNLEIFDILRERDRPTIALGMGEFGLMSRALAPKFGAYLTFASLRDSSATAPGQPTVRELFDRYRFRSIRPSTRVYGVIGWPVAHSMSPAIHNAGFEWFEGRGAGEKPPVDQEDPNAPAFSGVYLPMPIAPGWEHFKATLGALLDYEPLDFRGASVTIPHKEHLLRFAREDTRRRWIIDPLALRVGAANTIAVAEDGSVRALNTDVAAVVGPLTQALGRDAGDLSGIRLAVIGAGGAARAALFGLLDAGASVVVCNRSSERAERLADEAAALFGGDRAQSAGMDQVKSLRVHAYINCTPVGMIGGPDPTGMPFDPGACDGAMTPDGGGPTVFETVYNPLETPLLAAAKKHGWRIIPGIEMFVAQAAAQFEVWTGGPPGSAPTGLFERVVRETLERRSA